MKRKVTRYDLAQDCFANLCHLYGYGCYCQLSNRHVWISTELANNERRGLSSIYDLQRILNENITAWMAEEVEIEDYLTGMIE